ncbi:MAG: type II toxin-antitoxin system Phd/YefM family antitoxin [Chitinispirillales bacterium]|jgi:prevent-host-death family protein|nr:type II toxin-antitoxin system Phd/YefM family antitoxin [Chitinispirillales bacterium]
MRTKSIRPISDLQNNLDEIYNTVHETAKPVYLTKNGYADMVILSADAFEDIQSESEKLIADAEIDARLKYDIEFQKEIEAKLLEAEEEMKNPNTRYYTPEEAFQMMEEAIRKCTE